MTNHEGELANLRHLANENGSTIAFLKQIIKDNELHESFCPAFDPNKGAGIFSGLGRGQCNCWLAPNVYKAEDHEDGTHTVEAIGIYDLTTKEVVGDTAFPSRQQARLRVLNTHPELSGDPKDPNYWMKSYLAIPVTLKFPEPESENDPSNL